MTVVLVAIALITSAVGSICGIGGGVIIKPVLDALGIMSVSTISFLSGCTVLAMALVSVGRSIAGGSARIDRHTTPFLGVGAAIGGVAGKLIFSAIKAASGNESLVGMIQAITLTVITAATLVYMLMNNAGKIKTRRVTSPVISAVIGLCLGLVSSFLGIGGGPINLAVLAYFFSLDAKTAAINSLCVILISQTASLVQTFATGSLPEFKPLYLVGMVLGGIAGGLAGQSISKRLSSGGVGKLFNILMLVVIGINIYNIFKFAGAM